jgi:hypothetical protein
MRRNRLTLSIRLVMAYPGADHDITGMAVIARWMRYAELPHHQE